VIGREFAIEVLEALGELAEDRLLEAIDEGVHAQLIAEAPDRAGRFDFVHALIRETLDEELTTTRRVRLHRRLGEAIERLAHGRSDPPLADLAYHFVQAASADVADKAIDMRLERAIVRPTRWRTKKPQGSTTWRCSRSSSSSRPPKPNCGASTFMRGARAFGALAQWALQKVEIEHALQHLDPMQIERRGELVAEMAGTLFMLLDMSSVERLAHRGVGARRTGASFRSRRERDRVACRTRTANGDLGGSIEMGRAAIARAGGTRTIAHAMLPLDL
jgi:hypothetical protein